MEEIISKAILQSANLNLTFKNRLFFLNRKLYNNYYNINYYMTLFGLCYYSSKSKILIKLAANLSIFSFFLVNAYSSYKNYKKSLNLTVKTYNDLFLVMGSYAFMHPLVPKISTLNVTKNSIFFNRIFFLYLSYGQLNHTNPSKLILINLLLVNFFLKSSKSLLLLSNVYKIKLLNYYFYLN